VIEGRLPLLRVRINDDELPGATHRFSVPEAVRLAYRGRRPRDIDRQSLVGRPQLLCTRVIAG